MGLLGEGKGITELVIDDLDDLIDVVITNPSDNQTLLFQGSTNQWVNASAAAGGSVALDDLTDVVITSPTSSQTLIFQGGTWVNASAPAGGGSGTVTSAAVSGKNGITVQGSPITTEGCFALGLLDITPRVITASGDISTAAGRITASAATITSKLTGATAAFSGLVSADGGIKTTTVSGDSIGVTGDINAAAGRVFASAATFTGKLTGATAAFSGLVSADAGIKTTTVSADSIGATGDINAAAGRVFASALTVTDKITASAASFTGMVSANVGLRATTVSASGVIGGSNLSGTNTGDQTITLQGDVTGTGTGTFTATLANTAVSAGTYLLPQITVDTKGRLTAAVSAEASAARTQIGLATQQGNFYLGTGVNTVVTLVPKARYAFIINSLQGLKTSAGTISATLNLNGSAVGGLSSITVNSSASNPAANGTNNKVAVGDRLTLVLASNASANDLEFTMDATR